MIIFLNFQTFLGIQILQNPNRGPGTPHPKWQNNSCPDDGGWPAKLWISRMFFMVFLGISLVNFFVTMENHHFLSRNELFLWPFSIAMLVYQRVSWEKYIGHDEELNGIHRPFYDPIVPDANRSRTVVALKLETPIHW